MSAFTGTKNFTVAEVICPCGCGMLPEADFMDKQQGIRHLVGFPLKVNSGARCAAYNMKVSTTGPNGPHTTGRAIDYGVYGERARDLVDAGITLGMTGIGVAQRGSYASRFIHFDDLSEPKHSPRPWIWTY